MDATAVRLATALTSPPPMEATPAGLIVEGTAKEFLDRMIDVVIQYGPTVWPAALKVLVATSVLMPGLRPIVAILQNVPADKVVDLLKQVRLII